jgi:hypothetical protein
MYLFGPGGSSGPAGPGPIEKELQSVEPDTLSARDALELIYHLKHLLNRPRE